MASKRKGECCGGAVKKKRKTIDLEMKVKIIVQHENGKSVSTIARDLGFSHSTISTIIKDKARIREAVKGSAPLKATIITKKRQGPIDEMEKLLVTWMEDQTQKRVPLSLLTIQAKARSLFEALKERAGDGYTQTFTASHGWFQRFKNRYNLRSVKVSGESASADALLHRYVDTLQQRGCERDAADAAAGGGSAEVPLLAERVKREVDDEEGGGEQLVEIVAKQLSDEYLVELGAQKVAKEEEEEEEQEEEEEEEEEEQRGGVAAAAAAAAEPAKEFSLTHMAEAFSAIDRAMQLFEEMDPNVERFSGVDRLVQEALACYREIYREAKRQTARSKLDAVLKEPGGGDPRPSTSSFEGFFSCEPSTRLPVLLSGTEGHDVDDLPSPASSFGHPINLHV
uniref:HTH CENPB-type domain-containing protein n=1 Tax=Scleropages formosus TaxID=113540 RepID=A0A8C9W2M3_SCLFO